MQEPSQSPKFRVFTTKNLNDIPQIRALPAADRVAIRRRLSNG